MDKAVEEMDVRWVKGCAQLLLRVDPNHSIDAVEEDEGKITMDKIAENKDFHEWWAKMGYNYKPESGEEADWVNVVKHWAWIAWGARAALDPPSTKPHPTE